MRFWPVFLGALVGATVAVPGLATDIPGGLSPAPSIGNTRSVDFLGQTFLRKADGKQAGEQFEQFYLANESPTSWTAFADFRAYAVTAGNDPVMQARALAQVIQIANPKVRYSIFISNDRQTALIDFATWSAESLKGGYVEFNAYRFFKDLPNGPVLSFHYVKKMSSRRPQDDAMAWKSWPVHFDVLDALARFPTYRR
jgi:hypothetical protein